jgi:hypothetical protein
MANNKNLNRTTRQATSSWMSKFTMMAFVLVAILCFLPASNLVKADDKSAEKEDYGTVIGIDLGTTYSCVAYVYPTFNRSGANVTVFSEVEKSRSSPMTKETESPHLGSHSLKTND